MCMREGFSSDCFGVDLVGANATAIPCFHWVSPRVRDDVALLYISHILQLPVAFFFEGALNASKHGSDGSALSMAQIDDLRRSAAGTQRRHRLEFALRSEPVGYYNAKRNNRVIDLQTFEENMSKVTNFCSDEKNFKVPVMKAVEQVLGKSK